MLKKIAARLKDKSGASIFFVLSIMLMLLMIGTSALVAASAGAGGMKQKRDLNQLNLYADSVQQAFMYSLQTEEKDNNKLIDAGTLETLGGLTLREIYAQSLREPNSVSVEFLISDISLGADAIAEIVGTRAKTMHFINSIPEVQAQPAVYDEEGTLIAPGVTWQPRTVSIDGSLLIDLEVRVREKELRSLVEYGLSGAELRQEPHSCPDGCDAASMRIAQAGEWEVISNEKIAND